MPYQPPLGDPSLPQPNIPPPFPPPLPISFRTPSRTPWIVAVAMTAAAGYGAYWGFSERTKWKAKAEVAEGKAREALVAGESLHSQLGACRGNAWLVEILTQGIDNALRV
jgi:hypothetical protein